MSDISGFDWWFRNRDYVLRENIESLEASAAAAASRSARMSSQLSRLQGSLEHRLNALSAAFDAYVRLGDIREQLAAYAEAATIRREAIGTIGALGDGQPAAPIDDRGTGYWVAPATNAVVARVSGSPDPAAEEAVRSQDPDAGLFLVAATGALGHGSEVADQVAAALHSEDGELGDHQLALWHAVVRGDFGPDVLRTVLVDWNDQLNARPEEDWWNWASAQGSKAGRDGIDWIEDQASGKTAIPAQQQNQEQEPVDAAGEPSADQRAESGGLRGLVLELINSGFGDERELLTTARELRAKIEHPDGGALFGGGAEQPPKTPIVDAVRASYLAAGRSPAKAELFAALAPALGKTVEAQSPRLLSEGSAVVPVRIAGVAVDVTPDGPDRDALQKATEAASRFQDPAADKFRLYAFGGATVLCAVVALIVAVTGLAVWLVVLLLIAAVILGILAVRTLLAGRHEQERLRAEAADRDRSIEEATEKAATIKRSQREAVQKAADQLDRLRALLSGGAPVAPAEDVQEQGAGLIS